MSFVRPVQISLCNYTQILILAPMLFIHLHPRFGTNCPLKSSLHTHSRLSRASLKLTISANHLPRSRASPRLRFVPYFSSELAVLDPGVFKLSLLLLLSRLNHFKFIHIIPDSLIDHDNILELLTGGRCTSSSRKNRMRLGRGKVRRER